ncbi:hypothetical protein CR513_50701, partial [Mucuna pruriens]
MEDAKPISTLMHSFVTLSKDEADIMFSMCLCARFQSDPMESHLKGVKRMFRYLIGTNNLILFYKKTKILDRKKSIVEDVTSLDHVLCHEQAKSRTPLYYLQIINLFKNPIRHSKTKDIEIKHHFIRNYVQKGVFEIKFIDTDY